MRNWVGTTVYCTVAIVIRVFNLRYCIEMLYFREIGDVLLCKSQLNHNIAYCTMNMYLFGFYTYMNLPVHNDNNVNSS